MFSNLRIWQIPAFKIKPQIGFFVYFACACVYKGNLSTLILGPSSIIDLAQVASLIVALLAELVEIFFKRPAYLQP